MSVAYAAGALTLVLAMPEPDAVEHAGFAQAQGFSCLGTWRKDECLELCEQLLGGVFAALVELDLRLLSGQGRLHPLRRPSGKGHTARESIDAGRHLLDVGTCMYLLGQHPRYELDETS